jgi:hypothetical protein
MSRTIDTSKITNWLGVTNDRFKDIVSEYDRFIREQEKLIQQGLEEVNKQDAEFLMLQEENKNLTKSLEEEKKRAFACQSALENQIGIMKLRQAEIDAEIDAKELCERETRAYKQNLTAEQKRMREYLDKIHSSRATT